MEERSEKEAVLAVKILVVRYAAMGDSIMTAWTVSAIKNRFPEAEIVWAIQTRCAPVIAPELARTAIFERDKRSGSAASLKAQFEFYRRLREEKFDVGFDFQGHVKTAICLKMARPKLKFALASADGFTKVINRVSDVDARFVHTVEREGAFASLYEPLTLPRLPYMPDYSHLAPSLDKPLITIQTGAGAKNKTYPIEQWQEVADHFSAKGFHVTALGGPKDPHLERVDCRVGKMSLEESLAWVAASRIHLAADTGTGHAAAAYGVPTLSIFGPTDDQKFRPWGESARLLKRGDMAGDVPAAEVIEEAEKIL